MKTLESIEKRYCDDDAYGFTDAMRDAYELGKHTNQARDIIRHIERICEKCGHETTTDGCAHCLGNALRVIATQSTGDDWTPEQAFSFVRQYAREEMPKQQPCP